jgi:CDP-glucose 4,6-dehydratase
MDLSFWKDKSVLLTGHTGFKGSWMAFLLDWLGARVTGYALQPTAEQFLFDKLRLETRINHRVGDILDRDELSNVIKKSEVEVVIHMAAQSLVRESYKYPVETYMTNMIGTATLLDCLRSEKSAIVVLIVTSDKCYANNESGLPFVETDPLGGRDPYSSSKACTELLVQSFRDSFCGDNGCGLHLATARAGNVIGGGDGSQDRLIPDAIRAFSSGRAVQIRNAEAVRPWQHVLEPLTGYLTLCEQLYSNGKQFTGGWNFGPEEASTISVAEVIRKITSLYGNGAKFEFIATEDQPPEASLLRLDSTKAKAALNWYPKWDLDLALEKTVCWYCEDLKGLDMVTVTSDQVMEFLE